MGADSTRRKKSPGARIGLESRFPLDMRRFRESPGPQYNPPLPLDRPSPPKFSFGSRREVVGQSPLAPSSSTPGIVGPGKYFKADLDVSSKFKESPSWTLPKQLRDLKQTPVDRHQSYDTKSLIGPQFNSKQASPSGAPIGKGSRDIKLGYFKDTLATQPTKLSIPMPKIV
eukprot:TRINITY_DN8838_c0_g1_i4.p1 TRINITY_DN8838_c0_g1~~TRINITY_DN8838_c0_g1_i4.p1  ORF type:complete len:171 (+),score=24.38 TRINITY_DN8838_c0_g1_i4:284-796(+)